MSDLSFQGGENFSKEGFVAPGYGPDR